MQASLDGFGASSWFHHTPTQSYTTWTRAPKRKQRVACRSMVHQPHAKPGMATRAVSSTATQFDDGAKSSRC